MQQRAVLAAVLAITAGVSSNAVAAPQPHVVDAAGDWAVASHDILSMTFSTVGRGSHAQLEMRVELSGQPDPDVGHWWEVAWRSPGCARNVVVYTRSVFYPGEETARLHRQCADGGSVDSMPAAGRLEGSSLVLAVPLGSRFRPGAVLSAPEVTSFAAVFVAGAIPSYVRADGTEPGRSYRVGSRN